MNNEGKANSFEPEDMASNGGGSKHELTASRAAAGSKERSCSVPSTNEKSAAIDTTDQAALDRLSSPQADREPRTDQAAVPLKLALPALSPANPGEANPSVQNASEKLAATETPDQVAQDSSLASPVESAPRTDEVVSPIALKPVLVTKRRSVFEEQTLPVAEMASQAMRHRTRRQILAFGIGAAAMAIGAVYLLPQDTLKRLGAHRELSSRGKEWLLNNALRVDDDVAEALYSHNRMVPTYTRSQITPIKNNYNGATPDAGYISGWRLILEGLDSGLSVSLDIRTLTSRFPVHDQITRFVCVEGWSAIGWWAGLRFDDLLRAYPPKSQAKWARVESSVNLDNSGNSDPYFVSIDLATARHPQTLLATYHDGQPLTLEHGAPLRLLAPVKLGLKNVKAITRITFLAEEPKDYWARYGYSSYDGI